MITFRILFAQTEHATLICLYFNLTPNSIVLLRACPDVNVIRHAYKHFDVFHFGFGVSNV